MNVFQAFVTTLSQLSAKLTPRHNQYKNTVKNKTQPILCSDSFLETIQNFDFSIFKNLNIKHTLENNYLNNFHVSYVSCDSFFENKHGFSEDKLLKDGIPTLVVHNKKPLHVSQGLYQKLAYGILHENRCTFNIQLRGFKTERSIKAELVRNPSLIQRVKNVLGFSQTDHIESKLITNSINSDKLKTILATNETLNETEKDRIKVAFAEGYLLGNNTNAKGGKASRYFKLVQQILTIVLFLGLIISLMASAGGSAFRLDDTFSIFSFSN